MSDKEALLVLRDGRVFRGRALGAEGETHGEVIFNTAMSGYQEILTDPSYRGQIVTMTYPMIGNYGINEEDVESHKPWANGLIVKEASACPSSWRGRMCLDDYLKAHGLVGLQGIDTRALTRHLRDAGAQDGIISSVEFDIERLRARAATLPSLVGREMFRARVTSYRAASFEDLVIFVTDVERCVEQLSGGAQAAIARVIFQEYTITETAQALGVSLRTVHNDWAFARAWLYRALTDRGAE